MSGVMFAMPLLVINMGGEMVYILQQRLQAQRIAPDKAKKGNGIWLLQQRGAVHRLVWLLCVRNHSSQSYKMSCEPR